MTQPIDSFSDQYRFLSNFHPCKVIYEGIEYPSVEHAYQAAKSLDPKIRLKFSNIKMKAGYAKYMGRKIKIREDWSDELKLKVMEDLIRSKFTENNSLELALFNTGNAQLIEGNYWKDYFWGVCKGRGENHLGKILMKIRGELSAKSFN